MSELTHHDADDGFHEIQLSGKQLVFLFFATTALKKDPARIEAIDRLAAEVRSSGAQLVLAPDSEFAAAHAAGEGLIAATSVADVRADKRGDQAPTSAA